jgi:nitrite reductase/ring-hydroxylating ferredoxin subunit
MSEIEYHAAAKTDEIPEEDVKGVVIGEEEIAIYNVEGEYYATHGICTHENIALADGFVEGELIECPLHSACFEIKTGKAVNPPAEIDLKTYPVKVEGDTIYVGIEK